ncbi:MAG TPA: hypothetical protein VGX03_04495 [Candidatus Binatia bacterium]|nr:hypothetical protein [Candidatus Binatia bacterium]
MTSQVRLGSATEAIASALKQITTDGDNGNFAVLDIDSSKTYYAQFAAQRGDPKIYAEVVGNEYIEPPYQLSAEQTARIEAAGWTSERVGNNGGAGNYGREWILDASHSTPERVAEEIIALFQNVYGVSPSQDIEITVTLEK